jgi:PAS domain S-box-containing protein
MVKPRILIIDDDPNLMKTLFDILRLRGLEPMTAGNGAEGLALMRENPFNIALIDLGLPDISGIEVLKRIKADWPATEIIILTGRATMDSAIEAANRDAFSYLLKPYEIEQLMLNIQRALEKQLAEQALRDSEERFRLIAESINEVFWIADVDLREMIYVSPGYERIWGQASELLYQNPLSFMEAVHPGDRDRLIKELEIKKTGQPFELEYRIIRPDGSVRWIWDRGYPVRSERGEVGRYVGVAQDITDRKLAEEAALSAKEEWERTFDAITDPIMIVDTGHRIVKANKAMVVKLGFLPADTDRLICYEIFHGTDEPPPFCPHSQLLADGRPHSVEAEVGRLGGEFLVAVSPLFGPDGKLQGSIHFARDITERKNLERQLQHSQKMEAIGTLAGGIAHDFNNILTAINGFGCLLKMHMAKDEPMTAYVDEIISGADRAAKLTRSLLTFSRKQEVYLKRTDLNEVVSGVEKMLRRLIREDIVLSTRLTPEELVVMADAAQIEQVLMNLAANARDAICENGIITIGSKMVELSSEFRMTHGFGKPGRYALLTFSDSGAGMDEHTLHRIFEPFFTTKEVGKGTGLGLSVAYGIIKQHHGFITCYSEHGRGTTFRLYLPIIGEAAEKSRSAPEVLLPMGTETILLAEDDAMPRKLSRLILEKFGYRVIEATNGEEAVTKFMANKDEISLALLDVIMPRMNGKEAFRLMDQIKPGTKVIYISGYTADIFQKEEKLVEGMNFLSKPIMHNDLLLTVRKLLDS